MDLQVLVKQHDLNENNLNFSGFLKFCVCAEAGMFQEK